MKIKKLSQILAVKTFEVNKNKVVKDVGNDKAKKMVNNWNFIYIQKFKIFYKIVFNILFKL